MHIVEIILLMIVLLVSEPYRSNHTTEYKKGVWIIIEETVARMKVFLYMLPESIVLKHIELFIFIFLFFWSTADQIEDELQWN